MDGFWQFCSSFQRAHFQVSCWFYALLTWNHFATWETMGFDPHGSPDFWCRSAIGRKSFPSGHSSSSFGVGWSHWLGKNSPWVQEQHVFMKSHFVKYGPGMGIFVNLNYLTIFDGNSGCRHVQFEWCTGVPILGWFFWRRKPVLIS